MKMHLFCGETFWLPTIWVNVSGINYWMEWTIGTVQSDILFY